MSLLLHLLKAMWNYISHSVAFRVWALAHESDVGASLFDCIWIFSVKESRLQKLLLYSDILAENQLECMEIYSYKLKSMKKGDSIKHQSDHKQWQLLALGSFNHIFLF